MGVYARGIGGGVDGPPVAISGVAFAPCMDIHPVAADADVQGCKPARIGIDVLPLPLELADGGVSGAGQGDHEHSNAEPETPPFHRSSSFGDPNLPLQLSARHDSRQFREKLGPESREIVTAGVLDPTDRQGSDPRDGPSPSNSSPSRAFPQQADIERP